MRLLVHELRVHQIELEMQNEKLSRSKNEVEISKARYIALFDQAPMSYLTSSENGLILEATLPSPPCCCGRAERYSRNRVFNYSAYITILNEGTEPLTKE